MVRKKNVGDTVMTSFAITCLVTILWLFFTYSLAFRSGTPFIGGFDRAFLQGIVSDTFGRRGDRHAQPLAPTIPETVYSMFQMTFAIITPALIAGVVRRAHEVLGDALVHRPVGDLRLFADRALGVGTGRHLQQRQSRCQVHVLDFAGGTVVHINSGIAGLMCGADARQAQGTPGPRHNMVLTMIGASLLWVGWFGFNAGSAVTAGMQAGMAMTVTHLATADRGASPG